MSKLTRRKKYPPPYDDKVLTRTEQTSPPEAKAKEMVKDKKIYQRAILSAKKHGLNLEPGTQNLGNGNCSYEAALFNINDRSCFKEKFLMSPHYYRRIWNTDMMNKLIYELNDWNPGLTDAELRQGFSELMESGIYERPFFGDMMMAGIACGIRKRILIFNTNEKTTHDPISVVDPANYGGKIDSEIPVVVAYDLVHFESMHPVENRDIDESIKLVNSYIATPSRYAAEYGFTRSDIKELISKDVPGTDVLTKNRERIETTKDDVRNTEDEKNCFKFGSVIFEELNNRMARCGVCQKDCLRPVVHLNGNASCSMKFDMLKLKIEYSKYRSRMRFKNHAATKKGRETCKNMELNETMKRAEKKNELPVSRHTEMQESPTPLGFVFDRILFKEMGNGSIRCGVCQNEYTRLVVHLNRSEGCNSNFDMAKFKTDYSNYRHRYRNKKLEMKKKTEGMEDFKLNAIQREKKRQAKRKTEDLIGFQKKAKESKNKHEAKKRADDMEKYKADVNKRQNKRQMKRKAEDPDRFIENAKKYQKKYEHKMRARDITGFKENIKDRKRKSDNNIGAGQRICRFRNKVLYGPIFL